MKKKLIVLSSLGVVFAPLVAFAAAHTCTPSVGGTVVDLFGLLCRFQSLLNAVIPFAIALGVVYLVWGIVMYVIASEEEAKKKGRDSVVAGIIGLVVIIALWGLVRVVVNTLDLNRDGGLQVPCVPGQGC